MAVQSFSIPIQVSTRREKVPNAQPTMDQMENRQEFQLKRLRIAQLRNMSLMKRVNHVCKRVIHPSKDLLQMQLRYQTKVAD